MKLTKSDWAEIHNPKPGTIARLRKKLGPKLASDHKRTRRAQWRAGAAHIEIYDKLSEKLGEKQALTLMQALDDEVSGG